jgi:hypothetical protein
LAVIALNHLLGVVALGEVDEGEASWTTRFAVGRQHHLERLGDLAEQGPQIGFSCAVGQVSNE